MHEKLDQYLPTMEILSQVRRQLVDAGVEPDHIPQDWLAAIIAATRKWVASSPDGACDAINLLGFEWSQGDPSCLYEVLSLTTAPARQVKSEDVYFFRGIMADREPIMPVRLKISKKESKTCDSCGIISHCVQEIRHPRTERLSSYCSNCLSNHEDIWFRDYRDTNECSSCPKDTCSHNPKRYDWPTQRRA